MGRIDEAGVWNRRLTTTEVQSIFTAGQISPSTGLTPPLSQQVLGTYSFDALKVGKLAGQDFWTAPTFGNLDVKNGAGINTTRVAGEGDSNGLLTRLNNAGSAFVKFTGTETTATSQFDLTLTSGHGTGGGQIFGLGHDRNGNFAIDQNNEYGPMFGIRDGYDADSTNASLVSFYKMLPMGYPRFASGQPWHDGRLGAGSLGNEFCHRQRLNVFSQSDAWRSQFCSRRRPPKY